jgi:hypothetical protein
VPAASGYGDTQPRGWRADLRSHAPIALIRLKFVVLARWLRCPCHGTLAIPHPMSAGTLRERIRPVAVTGSALAVGLAGIAALGGWLTVVRAQSLAEPGAQSAHVATRDAADSGKAVCATCGVVAAVRTFEVRGDSAGGGEAQRPAGARTSYRVTVRMVDGSYRTLAQATPPTVGVGDRVRIAAGAVVREN